MHTDALTSGLKTGLGFYYLLVAAMNVGFAMYMQRAAKNKGQALLWYAVAGLFLIHGFAYLFARVDWVLGHGIKSFVNGVMNPVSYFVLSVGLFVVFLRFRIFLTEPAIAWAILNGALLFGGWAMTDANFQAIITKPDNVPITMLIFSVAFFTWLALRKAVINDERTARGEAPLEKLEDDKVLVWPDLV